MSNPEDRITIQELAARTVADIASSVASDLDPQTTSEFMQLLSDASATLAGQLTTAETVTVEPVEPESTPFITHERKSDEEVQSRYERYVDTIAAKRHSVESSAKPAAPKFGTVRSVNIPRRETPKFHKVPEQVSPVQETQPSDPIADMLEAYESLPNIGEAPIAPSAKVLAEQELQAIITNPKVRARVASQIAHDKAKESGKSKAYELAGRFVRVATDQIGYDPLEDSVVIDTLFRIENALESAKNIYLESGEDYEQTAKSKRMAELADEYPAVRDMLRYWKRREYGLPIKTSTVNYGNEGITTGGSWSPIASEYGTPIDPNDSEWYRQWYDEMADIDAGLEKVASDNDQMKVVK